MDYGVTMVQSFLWIEKRLEKGELMKNQHSNINNIIYKVQDRIKSIIGICILLVLLYMLAEIFPFLRTMTGQLLFVLIIFIGLITSSIILGNLDEIRNYIKRIKIYGIKKGRKYKPYIYDDINEYPKVYHFNISWLFKYNSITITDKFLDTGINIVNIIKKYIPEANEKLLSNILSYINKNYTKRMNKDNHSIMLDVGTKYGRMQVKFENEATVLFFTVSQIYGYGNIERTYEMQQVYEIITNNNELLHEIKELNLSSIFLYEVPLPWDPDYIEVEDEESDELYKLKYYSIEEVFNTIANPKYAGWKEYVLNFFTEFDKLSYEKAEKFLKLTSYPVPEEWHDMLMNKKYLKYIEKYKI